jgi:hypothetical protein
MRRYSAGVSTAAGRAVRTVIMRALLQRHLDRRGEPRLGSVTSVERDGRGGSSAAMARSAACASRGQVPDAATRQHHSDDRREADVSETRYWCRT